MKLKERVALAIGIAMAAAFLLSIRGVVIISEDYSLASVDRRWNTVGLVVTVLFASASAFEAYRFLRVFFTERRMRRALRHFN